MMACNTLYTLAGDRRRYYRVTQTAMAAVGCMVTRSEIEAAVNAEVCGRSRAFSFPQNRLPRGVKLVGFCTESVLCGDTEFGR